MVGTRMFLESIVSYHGDLWCKITLSSRTMGLHLLRLWRGLMMRTSISWGQSLSLVFWWEDKFKWQVVNRS